VTDPRSSLSDLLAAEREAMVRPASATAQSLEGVQAALAAGRPPIVDVPPPPGPGTSWVAKLTLIVGVVVVGAGVAIGVGGGFTADPPATVARAAAREDPPEPAIEDRQPVAVAPIPAETDPVPDGPGPPSPAEAELEPAPKRDKPRRAGKPRRELGEPDAGDGAFVEELRLLREAKRAANAGRRDAALRVLQTQARRFPSGSFAQDRRALQVQLLCALGRKGEAASARRSFERDYPASPHKDRIASACR
jgi:hypothetical protein